MSRRIFILNIGVGLNFISMKKHTEVGLNVVSTSHANIAFIIVIKDGKIGDINCTFVYSVEEKISLLCHI